MGIIFREKSMVFRLYMYFSIFSLEKIILSHIITRMCGISCSVTFLPTLSSNYNRALPIWWVWEINLFSHFFFFFLLHIVLADILMVSSFSSNYVSAHPCLTHRVSPNNFSKFLSIYFLGFFYSGWINDFCWFP